MTEDARTLAATLFPQVRPARYDLATPPPPPLAISRRSMRGYSPRLAGTNSTVATLSTPVHQR